MPRGFSRDARSVVLAATNAAAMLGAANTEAEHFLIALLVGPPTKAQAYLRERGLTHGDVERAIADVDEADVDFDEDDAAALRVLGFDLQQILHQLEERFGPVPRPARRARGPRKLRAGLGDSARDVLRNALVEASYFNVEISPEHILLALLREPSALCEDLAAAYSLTYEAARDHLFPPPQSHAS